MARRSKKVVAAVAIVVCVFAVLFVLRNSKPATEFSTAAWLNGSQKHRYLMLDDLYAQYDLAGMRRAEIVELLGAADSRSSDKWYAYTVSGGLFQKPTALVIVFDDSGLVTAYSIAHE